MTGNLRAWRHDRATGQPLRGRRICSAYLCFQSFASTEPMLLVGPPPSTVREDGLPDGTDAVWEGVGRWVKYSVSSRWFRLLALMLFAYQTTTRASIEKRARDCNMSVGRPQFDWYEGDKHSTLVKTQP